MFINHPRSGSTEGGVIFTKLSGVTKTHIPVMAGQFSLKSYVSSVGGFNFANLPSLSSKGSVERSLHTNFKITLTDGIILCMSKMLQRPSRTSGGLILPSLTLFVLMRCTLLMSLAGKMLTHLDPGLLSTG